MTRKTKPNIFVFGLINFNWSLDIDAKNIAIALNKEKYNVYVMLSKQHPKIDQFQLKAIYRVFPDRITKYWAILKGIFLADLIIVYRLDEYEMFYWAKKLLKKKSIAIISFQPTTKLPVFNKIDKLYALSSNVKEKCQLLGIPIEETILINPIHVSDFEKVRSIKINLKHLVFVGNNFRHKGIIDLLYVAERTEGLRIHIVGGYPEESAFLNEQLKVRQLKAQIIVHGRVDKRQLTKIVSSCDLHVLPSRSEGRPKVVMELAAAGLPSILYRGYGAEEYINDWHNGLIVDSKEDLLESINKIKENPELLRNMSSNTDDLYKNFVIQNVIEDYEREIDLTLQS